MTVPTALQMFAQLKSAKFCVNAGGVQFGKFPSSQPAMLYFDRGMIYINFINIVCICLIGESPDVTVLTSEVRFDSSQPQEVEVIFRTDGIAQEDNDTVTLELVPLSTTSVPSGENIFFLDTIDIIIIDTDGEYICLE